MLQIKVTNCVEDFNLFSNEILNSGCTVIGLDTETSINAENNGIDILQLCINSSSINSSSINSSKNISLEIKLNENNNYIAYIFMISKFCISKKLKQILENNRLIKVGCDITNDIPRMQNSFNFIPRAFVDTQYIAKSLQLNTISLDGLGKLLVNMGKSNLSGTSNNLLHSKWNNNLSDIQIKYAGLDAYLSLVTYTGLLNTNYTNTKINDNNNDNNKLDLKIEALDIFKYLKYNSTIFQSKKNITEDKIINILRSSYNKWVNNYSRGVIIEKTQSILKYLIDNKYLYKNPTDYSIKLYYKNKEKDIHTKDIHTKDIHTKDIHIEAIHTKDIHIETIHIEAIQILNHLKYKSTIFHSKKTITLDKLMNVLGSSYKPWINNYTKEIIVKKSKNVLNYLILHDYLYKNHINEIILNEI